MKQHTYEARIKWTGNDGEGTKTYRSYRRDHEIFVEGRPVIPASSDPAFRGDASRHNPEDLLVASLSGCHMLWYLHLCAVNQINVLDYEDDAVGTMDENADGSGQFSRVVLRPVVEIAAGGDKAKAAALHHEAHKFCFIARSVNFPVDVEPQITGG
ncbi:MAG TPA: OsmC family protein [Candidatus Didemnitutus sp.]|nr:OsmC family protein [Candidatus Didemnitutus sp.]